MKLPPRIVLPTIVWAGREWNVLASIAEEEKALIGTALIRLDRPIAEAIGWIREQENRDERDDIFGVTIEFVYHVPAGKTDTGRTFHTAGLSGEWPNKKFWRVEISSTLTAWVQRLVDLGDDRSYWQPMAWTQWVDRLKD